MRVSDKVRAGPFGSARVRVGPCGSARVRSGTCSGIQLVSDNVRGLCLVGSGPVGSGRARVVEFSYYRAMLSIRGTSHGPVSVCLSVTSRCSSKTAERIELVFGM